ncbi:MAG: pantoate--beta-alanine ligase, partial [Bacteroidales bacterium]
MKICKNKSELEATLQLLRNSGKTIGLVPTMGALHQGHASLLQRARQENDIVVSSVFVNPIQFNNPEDLQNYPRNFESDCKLLEENGCDLVFSPTVEEMYPKGESIEHFDFGSLEKVMEGKNRPGHFQGVGVIVSRLFKLIQPSTAYFGEKDFQQVAIIQNLVEQLHLPITIKPCPIIRESDGLALSSRNFLLTKDQRTLAPNIYKILYESKKKRHNTEVIELKKWVEN